MDEQPTPPRPGTPIQTVIEKIAAASNAARLVEGVNAMAKTLQPDDPAHVAGGPHVNATELSFRIRLDRKMRTALETGEGADIGAGRRQITEGKGPSQSKFYTVGAAVRCLNPLHQRGSTAIRRRRLHLTKIST